MKKILTLIICLFIFQSYSHSAIKYLYNGLTDLTNVSFPLFNDSGVYIGDTVIPYIKANDVDTNGTSDSPFITWEFAKTQLSAGDELRIIKSDLNYLITTSFTSSANLTITSNQANLFSNLNTGQYVGIIQTSNLKLLGVNYLFHPPSYNPCMYRINNNNIFNYNIFRTNYVSFYVSFWHEAGGSGNYIKNNYYEDIDGIFSTMLYGSNDFFQNNVINRWRQTYSGTHPSAFGAATNLTLKNNYIYNTISRNFYDGTPITENNYGFNNTWAVSSQNLVTLSEQDLLVINGDTYFFNRSDTAGFDITGLEFFLKYGGFDDTEVGNVLGLERLFPDTTARILATDFYTIDTKAEITSKMLITLGWNYDTQTQQILTGTTSTMNDFVYASWYPDSPEIYMRLIPQDTGEITAINSDTNVSDTITINDTTYLTIDVRNIKGASGWQVRIWNADTGDTFGTSYPYEFEGINQTTLTIPDELPIGVYWIKIKPMVAENYRP